jgi:hypothetical protein
MVILIVMMIVSIMHTPIILCIPQLLWVRLFKLVFVVIDRPKTYSASLNGIFPVAVWTTWHEKLVHKNPTLPSYARLWQGYVPVSKWRKAPQLAYRYLRPRLEQGMHLPPPKFGQIKTKSPLLDTPDNIDNIDTMRILTNATGTIGTTSTTHSRVSNGSPVYCQLGVFQPHLTFLRTLLFEGAKCKG